MSTQSEKPVRDPTTTAVINGDASGGHIDMSETNNNASLDVTNDTNNDIPPSEGSEDSRSSGSDKNESYVGQVDSNDVQTQQSDGNDSLNVNPEVLDFVNDVVTEAASKVVEKHGDAVHGTTSQTTDMHGSGQNGEYR